MTRKRIVSFGGTIAVAVALVTASGAATGAGSAGATIDLSSKAKVHQYLRSIHVNPNGVVIQRGLKNYAGPSCPGKGWTCSRAHRVVQIASGHGKNSFRCAFARCVVVQVTKSFLATNTATCSRTTGITQSCSISQTSTGANNNKAVVVEIATKLSGLTQSASQTASITQNAAAGSNQACVLQTTNVDGSTVAKKGQPVTVTLEAHQSISIVQNSATGGNTVQGVNGTQNDCGSDTLEQTQLLSSTATGSTKITQLQNAAANGANLALDIQQNQGSAVGTATVKNTAKFSQTNTLSVVAVTPVGPVVQTQSSDGGGIQAKVNQFSHGISIASATQTETQCEHAQSSGTASCTPGTPPSYSLNQMQFGPASVSHSENDRGRGFHLVRKGPCCSVQGDNTADSFVVSQSSTQKADDGANQKNTVQGDCTTSGNCNADQKTNINGNPTQTTTSGQNVTSTINCSGSDCIVFDVSPGTNAPPLTLGPVGAPYMMTPFGPDPQADGATVTGVSDPAGSITFSQPLTHTTVGSLWTTWSHGYTGDVYFNGDGSPITITLPANTKAFYVYAEPNTFNVFDVTATAQDGTTTGPIPVQGNSGARYFGFYGTGNATIATITVSTTDTTGLGIGEFGIFPSAVVIP